MWAKGLNGGSVLKTVQTSNPSVSVANPENHAAVIGRPNVTVVSTVAGLRKIEGDWRLLESQAPGQVNVFQSFDWVMAWSEACLQHRPNTTLHILLGYQAGQVVFIWPLMRTQYFGFAALTWLTEPFGQYGDVLCKSGQSPRHWMTDSIAFLKRLNTNDILRLRHVRADALLAQHGQDLVIDAKMPEKAPALDLTQFATDADYDARYNQAQRKRRKKIRKTLEAKGVVEFKRLPTGPMMDLAIQTAIAEKHIWLSERGRVNRVFGCPEHGIFLENLSRQENSALQLVTTELTVDGKPVSWEIGFRHRGTHFAYITSHVNAFTDLSPGRLHMDLSQRACLADGMTTFDLMIPNDAHKESWSSSAVDTNDYYVPLSIAGSALGRVYIRTLRPLIRRFYYRATSKKSGWNNFFKTAAKPPKDF
jgi:CelD/BcsL family acetyltransferase involved in cellulose biosynthesis